MSKLPAQKLPKKSTHVQIVYWIESLGFDIYETKMAPFIFIIQFLAAKKLVILPHRSFNRLAAEVGDPTDRSKVNTIRY